MIQQSLKIELAIDSIIYNLRLRLLERQASTPISLQHEPLASPSCYFFNTNIEPSSSSSSLEKKAGDGMDDGVVIPPTPLWGTFNIFDKISDYSDKDYLTVLEDRFSISASRRRSDASTANDDEESSPTSRFERRKQIKSTQFFIAPDLAWDINKYDPNNGKPTEKEKPHKFDKSTLSIVIPK
jgi:hypothetical protein